MSDTKIEYGSLARVYELAVHQASHGKGKERHAVSGEAFEGQTMCEIARRLTGNPVGSLLYQAVKKCYESGRLPADRAIAELLGAQNYIAGAIIVLAEQTGTDLTLPADTAPLTMP